MIRQLAAFAFITAAATLGTTAGATEPLKIHDAFVLNGVALTPGDYQVTLSPSLDSVQLTKGHETVVSAPCKVSPLITAISRDEVHSRTDAQGHDEIVRLVLAGARVSVEILHPATATAAAPVTAGGAGGTR
jgi:hypothetical protein